MLPTELARSTRLLFALLLAVPVCAADQPKPDASPRLVAIHVPKSFSVSQMSSPTLFFELEGADLSPLDQRAVVLSLVDAEGRAVDAVFTHVPLLSDLMLGNTMVGLRAFDSKVAGGAYRLCGNIAGSLTGVCADIFFQMVELTPCQQAFIAASLENPSFGCACRRGEIRHDPAAQPDGSLGAFTELVGGNRFGPFARTDAQNGTHTSVYKFEAHFEIEIVNDPGVRQPCSQDEWRQLAMTFLCSEGQFVNSTHRFLAGTPDQFEIPLRNPQTGRAVPYNPKPTHADQLTLDGHGYRVPGESRSPSVTGTLKAHDSPNTVHWLDVPGFWQASLAKLGRLAPVEVDTFFRSFVHGSAGQPDCDLYFGARTGIPAGGAGGDAELLQTPVQRSCRAQVLEGPRSFRTCATRTRAQVEAAETAELETYFRDACPFPCRRIVDLTARVSADVCHTTWGEAGRWTDVEYTVRCDRAVW
jgi:hypothetical protein